jgi:hypothetical protein
MEIFILVCEILIFGPSRSSAKSQFIVVLTQLSMILCIYLQQGQVTLTFNSKHN